MNPIQAIVPWIGLLFWIGLWTWVMLADPGEKGLAPTTPGRLKPPEVELQGFSVRYMTRYSDFKTTWLELMAEKGKPIAEGSDIQLLEDITVRVVIKNESAPEESESKPDLTKQLGIDWLLIESATGLYTFDDRGTIELHGDVEVFGYNRVGALREWIAADTLVFDQDHGQVHSVGPAYYSGKAGVPIKAEIRSNLDLTQVEIDIPKDNQPETFFETPFTNPSMAPPYDPPSALRFLDQPQVKYPDT